ncbi:MAG: AAA family ATPase, partial [Bacteroidia bacterium]|nr:AAA family ATPase [Bacteroidia bacterium]
MLPIRLRFKGLLSFDGKTSQEIDFSELSSGGIFGIFGKVGSGKTTILDAMMIALYGETPRKPELKELINRNSDKAEIEFEFSVKSQFFRSQVVISQKGSPRKQFYRFNTQEKKWEPLEMGKGQKAHEEMGKKLVGLDYDSFTKCIILPQGQFHEFLMT